ncbi:MAG: hydrolase, partial [Tardiphaga sp.]|nr:hydrolase [Tardiphaga sp.]
MTSMTETQIEPVLTEHGESRFLKGFRLLDVALPSGITIRAAVGGEGPPLLLLHGHPQTH